MELEIHQHQRLLHRWIQIAGSGCGKWTIAIDVADYTHLPDGPSVLLVGHEGNYALDCRDGRQGLYYYRKRRTAQRLTGCWDGVWWPLPGSCSAPATRSRPTKSSGRLATSSATSPRDGLPLRQQRARVCRERSPARPPNRYDRRGTSTRAEGFSRHALRRTTLRNHRTGRSARPADPYTSSPTRRADRNVARPNQINLSNSII